MGDYIIYRFTEAAIGIGITAIIVVVWIIIEAIKRKKKRGK